VTTWTTPADIRAETERLWTRGLLLACLLKKLVRPAPTYRLDSCITNEGGAPIAQPPVAFPYRLRLRRPAASEFGSSFEAVRTWVRSLEEAARPETGVGFEIEWEEVNTRQLGRNRLPAALILPALDNALAVIGRCADAGRFGELATATLVRFPELEGWIARKPLVLLEQHTDWPHILDVLTWFAAHPRSGLYARQIDVCGVDTKFIEARKVLLAELLDLVLPAHTIEHSAMGAQQFELRYGLAAKPVPVRFRLLDPALAIASLTDLSVPASDFAKLDTSASLVFIVENEVTGLAFPEVPESLLIFGGGYGIDRLAKARWLCSRTIVYLGDIDTHGFAILDRLRALFPQTRSLLMDRETLLAHRAQWSFEASPQTAQLVRLDAKERAVYDDIRFDRLGSGIRLEQERIPFGWLRSAIRVHQ
jgi:hypothetical protein